MHHIGIVGLGMAVNKHALALAELADRATVAAAWSPSASRRQGFAATYGLPVVDTLDAVLADPRIDLVLVLTPPWTHQEIVGRCAAAGKDVLLEKPIEATLARSEALVAACEGIRLGVVLQNRFRTPHQRLRSLLREQALGEVISVALSVRWWRSAAYFAEPGRGMKSRDGGGVLLTQAIHAMDQMVDLLGVPDSIAGFSSTSALRRIDTEDSVSAAMRWTGGAIGTLDATTTSFPGAGERIEISGTKGSALLERTRLRCWLQDGGTEDVQEDGTDPAVAGDYLAHRRLIDDMLDAIEQDRAPGADGVDALKVHRLIDALLAG